MTETRNVAVVIGVAYAKPLPYLAGAINGARAFHTWALELGYDSRLLTDEIKPVTLQRLRDELESILQPSSNEIHRLLLYFAGHGLIREAEEGLWLLSDWYDQLRAVAVEPLKRRLSLYNIQQISIFADACRSLPSNIIAADLCADAVLGRGPVQEPMQPAIDKFVAAQDGSAAFMVPGANPEDDRCIFSGVLLEGLWGVNPKAFSAILKDKVTSRSLGLYLQTRVPEVAQIYKRKLIPSVNPSFPEGDDIYFSTGQPAVSPIFPPWLPPIAPVRTAGPQFTLAEDHQASIISEEYICRLPPDFPTPSFHAPSLLEKIQSQRRPEWFDSGAGFAVDGGTIRGIWGPSGVIAGKDPSSYNWRPIHEASNGRLLKSVPILIQFEDGQFAAMAALPGFIATVLRGERGVSALVYRSIGGPSTTATAAEFAIAQMESGALHANQVTDLAINLREMKHVDPVLGVISAYLYDSIGDTDNIRRMAFYYVDHNQPIPYDVALLAQIRGEWQNGLLRAFVPAVRECKPRTEAERAVGWTHCATPATVGLVGGFWPWMRQGWAFLEDPTNIESTLIHTGLVELICHLTSSRFTTLNKDGGRELAKIFNLSRIDNEFRHDEPLHASAGS
jgi:hypothetical protein